MTEHKIIVEKRQDDYLASYDGNRAVWGCGKSQAEAIGDLISAHRERFDIKLSHKEESG